MRHVLTLAAVVVLLAGCAAILSAQDSARAEELLKWFPQGKYMMVSHRDDVRLAQGDAYELYQKYFEPAEVEKEKPGKKDKKLQTVNFSFYSGGIAGLSAARILMKDQVRLPPTLKNDLYSITTAGAMSIIDEPQDNKKRVQTITIESSDHKSGGKQMGLFVMRDSSMAVYRYHDIEGTLAAALEKNELTKIGFRLGGRPIYSFSTTTRGHRSEDQFAWASETGELLVASDRKTLRKMYLAGHNRMPRLMDEPSYVDLVSVMPELGAKWSMHIMADMSREMADAFADEGADDEQLEKMRDRQRNNPTMRIQSLDIGERLISRSYQVYEESEAAEEAMAKSDQGEAKQMAGVQAWGEYQQMLRQRKETELRGNIIMTSVEIDEKLLKAEKSANAAMQKQLMQSGGKVTINTGDGQKMKLEIMHDGDGKDITIKTGEGDNKKKK